MRKTLIVGMMVMAMLVMSTGLAAANWAFDIVPTADFEDLQFDGLEGDGNDDATNWDIVLKLTAPDTFLASDNMTFFINEDLAKPANLTISHPPFGMPPADLTLQNGYVAGPSGDQGVYLTSVYLSSGPNFDHMFTPGVGMLDGDILFQIQADTGTALSWGSSDSFIISENTAPGDTTPIYLWRNGPITGDEMVGATAETSHLLHMGEAPPIVPASPAPPIPEIITIVLVSMGLIALGGYIWYRRHNMAPVAA